MYLSNKPTNETEPNCEKTQIKKVAIFPKGERQHSLARKGKQAPLSIATRKQSTRRGREEKPDWVQRLNGSVWTNEN